MPRMTQGDSTGLKINQNLGNSSLWPTACREHGQCVGDLLPRQFILKEVREFPIVYQSRRNVACNDLSIYSKEKLTIQER